MQRQKWHNIDNNNNIINNNGNNYNNNNSNNNNNNNSNNNFISINSLLRTIELPSGAFVNNIEFIAEVITYSGKMYRRT